MKRYSSYFYWGMLVVNLFFASYFVGKWAFAKSAPPPLPVSLLTENSLVKSEAVELTLGVDDQPFALALLSSKSSICADNKVAEFFRKLHFERPDVRIRILFSANTSSHAISNFKQNLGLDFDVATMQAELNNYWDDISREYEIPAIIIIGKGDGMVASDDLNVMRNSIAAY